MKNHSYVASRQCRVCGSYKARYVHLEDGEVMQIGCKCNPGQFIKCKNGLHWIRKPMTNYRDTDGKLWHTSYITGLAGCKICRTTTK